MSEISVALLRWQMDLAGVRERMYRAPTPRERERWHALWLLAQEWSVSRVAVRLRETRTLSASGWLTSSWVGPRLLRLHRLGVPPALEPAQQATLKAAVQAKPQAAGLTWTNWCWKAVKQFIAEHCGKHIKRTACIDYLHRLGFVRKRPKKEMLKADAAKVKQVVDAFFCTLTDRTTEASQRCRTLLQSRADALAAAAQSHNVDFIPVSL